jgi:alkanesulfonate monooxygenase SsuD/methylene tetrahydromethanopterin reductase-like flavin-dependent oxidoreductase (luciferase family)
VDRLVTRLALELSGAPADPEAALAPGFWVEQVQLAEAAGLDFVIFPDSFEPPGDPPRAQLDAVAVAARVAALTTGIGLVAGTTVTHTEPFHLSKAIATLDFVSLGRAGWQPTLSRTQVEADLFGRKDAAPAATLWREAAEVVEVVTRLCDSWEDDAVIRDAATGRYVDRDRLHYVDFQGEFFSVRGPSITPRSPQARPPIVLRLEDGSAGLVGSRADVVRVGDLGSVEWARSAVLAAGRDPALVTVLLDVPVERAAGDSAVGAAAEWVSCQVADAVRAGADGVTFVPATIPGGPKLVLDRVLPLLAERGLRTSGPTPGTPTPRTTLRERLGLARPANVYQAAR